MNAQAHTPNRTLANRRALGAAIGSLVGVIGWQLGEYTRFSGESTTHEIGAADLAFQITLLLLPIASATLICRWAALRWPTVGSGLLTFAVTVGSVLTTALFITAVGSIAAGLYNPLYLLGNTLLIAMFGSMRVGLDSLVAGWLIFYALDRIALRPGTGAQVQG